MGYDTLGASIQAVGHIDYCHAAKPLLNLDVGSAPATSARPSQPSPFGGLGFSSHPFWLGTSFPASKAFILSYSINATMFQLSGYSGSLWICT